MAEQDTPGLERPANSCFRQRVGGSKGTLKSQKESSESIRGISFVQKKKTMMLYANTPGIYSFFLRGKLMDANGVV